MKSKTVGLVIILIFLTGCVGIPKTMEAGNTGANLCVGGTVAGNTTYIVTSFGEDIVRSGPLGEDERILSEGDSALYLNLTEDGWIYFVNASDNYAIYRIREDGEERARVSEDVARYLNIAGEFMFYTDENKNMRLVSSRMDGTEKKILDERPCVNVVWAEGWVYYLTLEDGYLRRIREDGSKKELLLGEKTVQFDVEGQEIYFISAEGDFRRLMKMTVGEKAEELIQAPCTRFQVKDGKIYFQTEDTDGIQVLDTADGSVEVISEEKVMAVQIAGERIYYRTGDAQKAVYSIKMDGTDKRKN